MNVLQHCRLSAGRNMDHLVAPAVVQMAYLLCQYPRCSPACGVQAGRVVTSGCPMLLPSLFGFSAL